MNLYFKIWWMQLVQGTIAIYAISFIKDDINGNFFDGFTMGWVTAIFALAIVLFALYERRLKTIKRYDSK